MSDVDDEYEAEVRAAMAVPLSSFHGIDKFRNLLVDTNKCENPAWTAENFVRGVGIGVENYGDWENRTAGIFGDPTGFVYFIAIGGAYVSHIKVGFTRKNPYARMKSLQTGCPFKMKMIGFVFGNEGMEAEMHDVFSQDRQEGEWFAFSDHVEENIKFILTTDQR